MQKNVLIIEDEKPSMDALVKATRECDFTSVIYCADNSAMAYKYAMENRIDLFLIDIILDKNAKGDVSGIKFADKIRSLDNYKFTPIIFVTALEDQAMTAFHKLHCYGYIEKPFNFELIQPVISEALKYPIKEERKSRYIYYRKGGILFSLDTENIMYIEVLAGELQVSMTNQRVEIPYRSCTSIMKELNSENFLRCSKSAIVNRKFINYVDETNRFVEMKNGKKLEVGVVMKKSFLRELKHDSKTN